MQKRPSVKLPQDVSDRAVELRRAGKTIRAIALELDLSTSTVHKAVAGVTIADGARVASAEDLECADDLEQTVRDAVAVVRGCIRDVGQRLNGPTPSAVEHRDLAVLTRLIVELRKLAALLRGQATARVEQVQHESVAIEPSEEERRVLAALDAWSKGPAAAGLALTVKPEPTA